MYVCVFIFYEDAGSEYTYAERGTNLTHKADSLCLTHLAYQQGNQAVHHVERAEDDEDQGRADMVGQDAAHCLPDWNHGERAKRIQANDAPQFLAGDPFVQDGEVDRVEKGNAEAYQHTGKRRDDRRCGARERQAEN